MLIKIVYVIGRIMVIGGMLSLLAYQIKGDIGWDVFFVATIAIGSDISRNSGGTTTTKIIYKNDNDDLPF